MTTEQMANLIEKATHEVATGNGYKLHAFTPSIKIGRRYVGITDNDGVQHFIEINVQEA
jgi:hypothetical protein